MGDIFYIFQVIQACFALAVRERIPLIYTWTWLAALWLQGVQSPAPAGKPHWVSVELGHALWLDMEFWLIQGMSIPSQYLPAEHYGHTLLSSHPLLSGFQFGFSWYCFHLLVSWVLLFPAAWPPLCSWHMTLVSAQHWRQLQMETCSNWGKIYLLTWYLPQKDCRFLMGETIFLARVSPVSPHLRKCGLVLKG